MLEHFDVAIVGGGPGGSTCAWRLSQAGAKVVILDQKSFPRDKTCAGWVTPPVWNALQINLEDYRQGRVLQPITGFRTGMIGGREVETRYGEIVSYGIRRCEFDAYLLSRCGAELRTGHPVRSLVRGNGCWQINDTYEAPLLVGAGGHFCPVARLLGARDLPHTSVVTAQEIEFAATDDDLTQGTIAGDMPELFFCSDLNGYGWCFRKGSFLNIGLGRVGADHLADHVAAFNQFLRERGKVVASLPGRFHGHAYQLYDRVPPKLVDDGVLLVGDAAGLAHPQSGEGIRPAVESGLIAADVIREVRAGGSSNNLQSYANRIAVHFGQTHQRHPSDWLPHSWLSWAARQLMGSNWFTRRVVLDQWFLGQAV
jgi:geranylgeranyl reductase family protein